MRWLFPPSFFFTILIVILLFVNLCFAQKCSNLTGIKCGKLDSKEQSGEALVCGEFSDIGYWMQYADIGEDVTMALEIDCSPSDDCAKLCKPEEVPVKDWKNRTCIKGKNITDREDLFGFGRAMKMKMKISQLGGSICYENLQTDRCCWDGGGKNPAVWKVEIMFSEITSHHFGNYSFTIPAKTTQTQHKTKVVELMQKDRPNHVVWISVSGVCLLVLVLAIIFVTTKTLEIRLLLARWKLTSGDGVVVIIPILDNDESHQISSTLFERFERRSRRSLLYHNHIGRNPGPLAQTDAQLAQKCDGCIFILPNQNTTRNCVSLQRRFSNLDDGGSESHDWIGSFLFENILDQHLRRCFPVAYLQPIVEAEGASSFLQEHSLLKDKKFSATLKIWPRYDFPFENSEANASQEEALTNVVNLFMPPSIEATAQPSFNELEGRQELTMLNCFSVI